MSGIKVELLGLDAVLKELDVKVLQTDITDVLKNFGSQVARDAQNNLSLHGNIDRGGLSNSIGSESLEPLSVEIFANKTYAAYVEFGTRKFGAAYVATLPPTWQALAAKYQGKGGGDYFEFLNAILDWVMRKGIAGKSIDLSKQARTKKQISDRDKLATVAYAIALSIIRNGSKPHPFLFPAFEKNLPILLQDLKDLVNA